MRTAIKRDKYSLKDLHREIDLFDRKLQHAQVNQSFGTDAERASAIKTLTTKRETLVNLAQQLASEGIEFDQANLPRSMRPEGTAPAAPKPSASEPIPINSAPPQSAFGEAVARLEQQGDQPAAGMPTAVGWHADLAAYKRRRAKLQTA